MNNEDLKSEQNKRKEITEFLSKLTEKYLNPHNDTRIYYAKEVTLDAYTTKAVRVDYMQFKPVDNSIGGIEKGDFLCYEIKSSVEDFNSEHGHNLIGDLNYYVMPKEVYSIVKDRIPYYVGVKCPDGNTLVSVKNARRHSRKKPTSELLLMMFRSSNRENFKVIKEIKKIKKEKEDGKILELPFKVGDTAYFRDYDKYDTAEITEIYIDERGIHFRWIQYDSVYSDEVEVWDEGTFKLKDIGKTVFVNCSEQQKALKKRNNENE